MKAELELTLVTQIKETYAASVNLADVAKENARAAIEKAVECGQLLISAKTAVGHGRWAGWISNPNHGWNLTDETARKYMRLAEFVNQGGNLESATSQRQAFLVAGILNEPEREHGTQRAHGESCRWLSAVSKAKEQLNATIEKAPIDEWKPAERATLKDQLRPLAELYDRL